MLLAVQVYAMPRIIRIGGHHTEMLEIANSIAAGCGQAVSLARAYLFPVFSGLQTPSQVDLRADAYDRQYVDDVVSEVSGAKGNKRLLARRAAARFLQLLRRLRARQCRISPKTVVLSTQAAVGERVCKILSAFGFKLTRATHCRDLGVQTALGRRRVTVTQRKRQRASKLRSLRVASLSACVPAAKRHGCGWSPAGPA